MCEIQYPELFSKCFYLVFTLQFWPILVCLQTYLKWVRTVTQLFTNGLLTKTKYYQNSALQSAASDRAKATQVTSTAMPGKQLLEQDLRIFERWCCIVIWWVTGYTFWYVSVTQCQRWQTRLFDIKNMDLNAYVCFCSLCSDWILATETQH